MAVAGTPQPGKAVQTGHDRGVRHRQGQQDEQERPGDRAKQPEQASQSQHRHHCGRDSAACQPQEPLPAVATRFERREPDEVPR